VSRLPRVAALLLGVAALAGASPAWAATPANGDSFARSLSCDGRYALFTSRATNLVPGDTNGASDVFVRDLSMNVTHRVSEGPGHVQGNDDSFAGGISCDGRFVVFWSNASNLVPGDTNGRPDVFIRDRARGTVRRLSVSPSGGQANGGSADALISDDGRFVAFDSAATNLVRGDTNHADDVFVRDRARRRTGRVSLGPGGVQLSAGPYPSAQLSGISASGRDVTFTTTAPNALPPHVYQAVFLRDRGTARTTLVSRTPSGSPYRVGGEVDRRLPAPVSGDGRFVAFTAELSDFNDEALLLRDRRHGTTTVVRTHGAEAPVALRAGRLAYWEGAFFANGTTVCDPQVYLTDLSGAAGTAVSIPPMADPCTEGNALLGGALSGDGRFLAFATGADDLVAGDTNSHADVVVRELSTGTFTLVSTP
jgi:hypothetical protein